MESIVLFAMQASKFTLWASVASIVFLTGPLIVVSFFVRRLRPTAAVLMYVSTLGFSLTLWLSSVVITYGLWGGIALIVGLLFVGIGIVPVCLIAEVISASWAALGFTLFLIACSVVPKLALMAAMTWVERRDEAGAVL